MKITNLHWQEGELCVEGRFTTEEAARLYLAIYRRIMDDEHLESVAMQMLEADRIRP